MKIKVSHLRKIIREETEKVVSGGKEFQFTKHPERELSDIHLEEIARKLVDQYQLSYECDWKKAVKSYCDSMKATNGVLIDQEKLNDMVEDELEMRYSKLGMADDDES